MTHKARATPILARAQRIISSRGELPPCRYINLIKLKAQGLTNREIGKLLGIHETQVSAKLPEAIDWVESGCPPSHDRRTWGIYQPHGTQKRLPKQAPPPPPARLSKAALADESRFTRLLAMCYQLSRSPATVGQLASTYQTSERTIERDLVLLQELGFEVERRGRGKGLQLVEGVELPLSVIERMFPDLAPATRRPAKTPAAKPPETAAESYGPSEVW